MAKLIGRLAEIAISDTDSAYTDLGEVMSASPSTSHDLADSTTNDSLGWKEQEYADSQISIDVSMKYDVTNAGQVELLAASIAKTKKFIRFRPEDNSGVENEWRVQCTISDVSVDTSTGEVIEMSATFTSTAVPVQATQP